jgi:hypothetical protein
MNLIEIVKDMLLLCIERIFGLTSGCRTLEIIFTDYRPIIVIPVCSIGKVGDRLREREDGHYIIVAED